MARSSSHAETGAAPARGPLPPTQPVRPTDCLYALISRATRVATSVLKRELDAARVPQVRPAYLGVLMSLWNEDGLAVIELGRRAALEPSSMTGLLDRMERDGLIERRPDPSDRRAQRICLTCEGKRFRRPVLAVVARTLERASNGFSEDQISGMKEFLRHFLTNLQEERSRGHDETHRRV